MCFSLSVKYQAPKLYEICKESHQVILSIFIDHLVNDIVPVVRYGVYGRNDDTMIDH